jgi:hypothetical protein
MVVLWWACGGWVGGEGEAARTNVAGWGRRGPEDRRRAAAAVTRAAPPRRAAAAPAPGVWRPRPCLPLDPALAASAARYTQTVCAGHAPAQIPARFIAPRNPPSSPGVAAAPRNRPPRRAARRAGVRARRSVTDPGPGQLRQTKSTAGSCHRIAAWAGRQPASQTREPAAGAAAGAAAGRRPRPRRARSAAEGAQRRSRRLRRQTLATDSSAVDSAVAASARAR